MKTLIRSLLIALVVVVPAYWFMQTAAPRPAAIVMTAIIYGLEFVFVYWRLMAGSYFGHARPRPAGGAA